MDEINWNDLPKFVKVYIIMFSGAFMVSMFTILAQGVLFLTVARWVGTL